MMRIYSLAVIILLNTPIFGMKLAKIAQPDASKSQSFEAMLTLKLIHDTKQDGAILSSNNVTRMVPEKYARCSELLKGFLEIPDQKPDFLELNRNVKDYDSLASYFPQIYAITTAPDADEKRGRERNLVSALQATSQKRLGRLLELADYLTIKPMLACGATEIKNRLLSPQVLLQYSDGCPSPDEGYRLRTSVKEEIFNDILKDLVPLVSVHAKREPLILSAQFYQPNILAMVYSHDGEFIITGDDHGYITMVGVKDGKPTILHKPFDAQSIPIPWASSIALSADDKTLVTAGYDVNIWKISSLKKINEAYPRPIQEIKVTFIAREGKVVALSKGGILALGMVAEGTRLYHQEGEEFKELQKLSEPVTLPGSPVVDVNALSFADDGATLFAAYSNGTVSLFQPIDGVWQHLQSFASMENPNPISALAVSRQGEIAVAQGDMLATINLQSGDQHLLRSFDNRVNHITFSPDGNTLVAASKGVDVWSRDKAGKFRWSQAFGQHDVKALAFSPDGKKLATGNNKGILENLELSSKSLETTLHEKASLRDLLLLMYVMRNKRLECPHRNDELKMLYQQFHPDVADAVKDVLNEESCLVCKN